MDKYTEQEKTRRNSLTELEKIGINPYPAEEYEVNTSTKEIKEKYTPSKNNFQKIKIAGRIMSRRIMGKASFLEIKDALGKIQVYVNRDEICKTEDKSFYNIVLKNT